MKTSRMLITTPAVALRLNRCEALVRLDLPVGFHALPAADQDRAINDAAVAAAHNAIQMLTFQRMKRSA